jgi:hypothetical protein
MKALISPNEVFNYSWISSWVQDPGVEPPHWSPVFSEILNCQRIAEVEPDNRVFPVAEPLYWFDCPDDCKADYWYFKDAQVFIKPTDAPDPNPSQPVSTGTQTL